MVGPRVAVVLGAAVWAGGHPSPTLARRVAHAIELYRHGAVDMILGCGGLGAYPPSEAEVIAALCRRTGLPGEALALEARSTTTRENLSYAKPILRALNASRTVIVTDPYHAPRARLIAWQVELPATISCPRMRSIGWRQWRHHLPREALALMATALRLR